MTLKDILLSDDVVESIRDNMDYILEIIPEIKTIIGFEHRHPHHIFDVWEHTLYALSLSKNDFDVRLCLLLHDIGKPPTCIEGEDGVRHFKGHPKESANISRIILQRLGFDEDYINKLCFLIEHHDEPMEDELINNDYNLSLKLFEIQRCDALAHNPKFSEKRINYINNMQRKLTLKGGNTNGYF